MTELYLLDKTTSIFRYTIIIFPVISFYYVCIYYCQAVGKAGTGFFLSIYRQLLLFIPCLVLLGHFFGMTGVWTTYPLTDLIAAITGGYYLFKLLKAPYPYDYVPVK